MSVTVVRSKVFDVIFMGWRSTTVALQSAGWQIAVLHDPMRYSVAIELFHPELQLVLSSMWMDQMLVYGEAVHDHSYPLPRQFDRERPAFVIDRVIRRGDRIVAHGPLESRIAINARPEVIHAESVDFDDITSVFRPILVPKEKELIVDPLTVDQMLQQILASQQDKQAELRRKARADAPRQIHAQLVSVA